MKQFTVMLSTEGTNRVEQCDGIEHEGRPWLVPLWLGPASGEWKAPERIVPLAPFRPQASTGFGVAYLLQKPVPKVVLSGPLSPEAAARYGVILNPAIRIDRTDA